MQSAPKLTDTGSVNRTSYTLIEGCAATI